MAPYAVKVGFPYWRKIDIGNKPVNLYLAIAVSFVEAVADGRVNSLFSIRCWHEHMIHYIDCSLVTVVQYC